MKPEETLKKENFDEVMDEQFRMGILSQKAKEKEFLRRLKEYLERAGDDSRISFIDKLSEEIL